MIVVSLAGKSLTNDLCPRTLWRGKSQCVHSRIVGPYSSWFISPCWVVTQWGNKRSISSSYPDSDKTLSLSLQQPQKCGSHISDRCSVSFTPFLDHLRNPAPRHYAGMHPRLRLNNTFHVYSHSSHILKRTRFMNRRSHILSEFRYKTFRNAQLCHQWAEATSWFSQDSVQQPPW